MCAAKVPIEQDRICNMRLQYRVVGLMRRRHVWLAVTIIAAGLGAQIAQPVMARCRPIEVANAAVQRDLVYKRVLDRAFVLGQMTARRQNSNCCSHEFPFFSSAMRSRPQRMRNAASITLREKDCQSPKAEASPQILSNLGATCLDRENLLDSIRRTQ